MKATVMRTVAFFHFGAANTVTPVYFCKCVAIGWPIIPP